MKKNKTQNSQDNIKGEKWSQKTDTAGLQDYKAVTINTIKTVYFGKRISYIKGPWPSCLNALMTKWAVALAVDWAGATSDGELQWRRATCCGVWGSEQWVGWPAEASLSELPEHDFVHAGPLVYYKTKL